MIQFEYKGKVGFYSSFEQANRALLDKDPEVKEGIWMDQGHLGFEGEHYKWVEGCYFD